MSAFLEVFHPGQRHAVRITPFYGGGYDVVRWKWRNGHCHAVMTTRPTLEKAYALAKKPIIKPSTESTETPFKLFKG